MNPDNEQAAGSVRSSLAYVNTMRDQDRAIEADPLTVLRRRNVELTVVMPCLNEAETVATCVRKAMGFLAESGISGEVLVADNGSTDGSQQLAEEAGARVVPISDKGYGNALMGGIIAANGTYVIMGDADDSYDFTNLMPFVNELRKGADLVMGNRFRGRDRAGRHAAAAPVPRQPGAQLHRPPVLPQQDR